MRLVGLVLAFFVPWAVGAQGTWTPTLTLFRQGVQVVWPGEEAWGWVSQVEHRPGWDLGRTTATSRGTLESGVRYQAEDWASETLFFSQGLERWATQEGLANAGARAQVRGRRPWAWTLEATQILVGEATGLTTLRAETSIETSPAPWWTPRVEAKGLWATQTSEFVWVFSPFGGLLDGGDTGLWTAVAASRFTLYQSPGDWSLGWFVEPRLVAAGWVGPGGPSSPPGFGVGGATRFTVGRWGNTGVEVEVTFDPVRLKWFWKVGIIGP